MSRQTIGMIVQCALSIVIGCLIFAHLRADGLNSTAQLWGGLIGGFAGGWAVMFLYVWIRYGWKAARSMSMDP